MRRGFLSVLGMVLAATGGTRAQEAIATAAGAPAGGAPGPVPVVSTTPARILDDRGFDDRGPTILGPCGGLARVAPDGTIKPDKKPHGEVYAGVGTNGYRQFGGVVCQPLGRGGAVTVAVDHSEWGRGR